MVYSKKKKKRKKKKLKIKKDSIRAPKNRVTWQST